MVVPLGRALARAEEPILRDCGLTMWSYRVLLALAGRPARSQVALAEQIGADKTRLIPVLDELQESGLIERQPDPADRRARLLSVTPDGHRACATAQARIQRREDELLAILPTSDRVVFLRALEVLLAAEREETSPNPREAPPSS